MASFDASADPADDPDAWMLLDEAAGALRVSQQTLWSRLVDHGVDVRRIERDGRSASVIARADLERLSASAASSAAASVAARPTPTARPAEPIALQRRPRSLWQQLRELESHRDQLDFELRVVRGQLGDSRARAQHAVESVRVLREDLARAREQTETWRARCEPLQADVARDAATLAHERDRRASVERQLAMLIEIEEARERYCDRLEQRLNAPLRYRRGA
jgi:chromosome segregation ATPase